MRFLSEAATGNSRAAATGIRGSFQRPPWTTEYLVRENCISCGDCLRACPEGILVGGPAGTPIVDFEIGACTFCTACAEACDEAVFFPTDGSPWDITARIGLACFLSSGIACRSCSDACEEDALVFDQFAGGVGTMTVDPAHCTGCGACVASCPAYAIDVGAITSREAVA